MKLVQFAGPTGAPSAGIIRDGTVIALAPLLEQTFGLHLSGGAWLSALKLLHRAPDLVTRALQTSGSDRHVVVGLDDMAPLLPTFPLDGGGAKVVCTGANFHDHRAETAHTTKVSMPTDQIFGFLKAGSSLCGHCQPVIHTADVAELDFEIELAVIFAEPVNAATPAADLVKSIAGYTIFNDVTDRALQRAEMAAGLLCAAKNKPTYGPIGPALVTPDEVGNADALRISMTVNGEIRQNASTSDMISSVQEAIRYWSRVLSCQPGDVLTLGTPTGSGISAPPDKRRFLKAGDVMQARIDGIGTLENTVAAAKN